MTASSEYGVAVAEQFQPPENWVPGQEINKDASAVNTGNVDAFVRMWLDGSMRLMKQYKGGTAGSETVDADVAWDTTTSKFDLTKLSATEDENLVNAGLTMRVNNTGTNKNAYVKTLTRQQTLNAQQAAQLNSQGYASKVEGAYSEVQAMQSGILAYAPDGAEYTYLLKEETELPIYLTSTVNGNSTTGYKTVQVPAGTLVHVNASSKTVATLNSGVLEITATETVNSTSGATNATAFKTVYVQATGTFGAPRNVEYESFTPMTDGLYLFLRNDSSADQTAPEFSGYYMNGFAASPTEDDYKDATFYALNTNTKGDNRSDYTVKGAMVAGYFAPVTVTYDDAEKNIISAVPNANLELYSAKYDTIDAEKLKFYATAVNDTAETQTIYAVYDEDKDTTFDPKEDIVVEITTSNIGTSPEGWTSIGGTSATAYTINDSLKPAIDATKLTFYYNNDVEAGDSTAKLVDKVKLYDGVTNDAYLTFDFDLNVHLESIQVTFDENGKEAATAVSGTDGWAATGTPAVNTAAKATATVTNNEIEAIAWATT